MSDSSEEKQSLAKMFKIPSPKEMNMKKPVLIVEDQQDMRIIVASHLNKLGFQKVKQAANGYDALEMIRESDERFSLIVSDIEMPVLGGFELLQELRENPEFERPPFAITMDNPNKERLMFALENGADAVLVKPFSFNDIFPKVRDAFAKFHDPGNPEKVYEMAKALYRDDKLDEAAKVYQIIGQHTKTAARPFVGLAKVEIKRNNLDEAIKHLQEAEKRNENFVHVFSTLGEIYMKRKDPSSAIENFKKAITLSPLNPLRYEEAATPLFDEKRYEEGIEVLNIAISNELQFPALHNHLSQGYFALKDYKKAIRHIRAALAEDAENVVYLNQLGISLKESGDLDGALKTYNSVIKLDMNNKAAIYNKAILLHAKSDTAGAVKILKRLIEKNPGFEPAKKKLQEFESAA